MQVEEAFIIAMGKKKFYPYFIKYTFGILNNKKKAKGA